MGDCGYIWLKIYYLRIKKNIKVRLKIEFYIYNFFLDINI